MVKVNGGLADLHSRGSPHLVGSWSPRRKQKYEGFAGAFKPPSNKTGRMGCSRSSF